MTPHPSYGFLTEQEFMKLHALPIGRKRDRFAKQLKRRAAGRKAAHTRKINQASVL